MDSSLLDVSVDMIGETPKKKPTSQRSFAKDVVKCLAIVTPTVPQVESMPQNPYVSSNNIMVSTVCICSVWASLGDSTPASWCEVV